LVQALHLAHLREPSLDLRAAIATLLCDRDA
jgi:hypothetical protein